MSDFQTTVVEPTTLDPAKRVRYVTGLVLGVDELQQEQTYLIERDRLHQRGLHGYGTVHGLRVTVGSSEDVLGPEVRVSPGLAVDPHGQSICVDRLQCARLNAWLDAHRASILERFGSPPAVLSVYVVLCYRECETDNLPVPGGPCRSQSDTMTASRLADSFELQLALDPPLSASPVDVWLSGDGETLPERPPHVEEEAIRTFGWLLAQIEITDGPGPFLTEQELTALVRSLDPEGDASPPDASPPAGPYRLPAADAPRLLRLLFRIWITEVRPHVLGAGRCGTAPEGDDCVLLAELRFEVENDGDVLRVRTEGVPQPVQVVEDERPLLYSTRLLQEVLLHRSASASVEPLSPPVGSPPGGSLPDEGTAVLNDLLDVEALPTAGDDVLSWNAGSGRWEASPPPALVTDHGALGGLGDDDHPQYLNEPRGDARYALLNHTHALAELSDVDEDLTTVPPGEGQVLTWDDAGGQWTARTPQGGTGEGNFVQAVAGSYAVVAAGLFVVEGERGAVRPRGPVYNGLNVVSQPTTGSYVLQFGEYSHPDEGEGPRMYIVKGTIMELPDSDRATFEFVQFLRNGIEVRVLNVDGEAIQRGMGFMIEVSAYGEVLD